MNLRPYLERGCHAVLRKHLRKHKHERTDGDVGSKYSEVLSFRP